MNAISHKKGATFSLAGTCLLPGTTTWTAASQVRDAGGGLVSTLAVVLTPLGGAATATASHAITLTSPDDTSVWDGKLFCDVLYTGGDGSKVPSDTFEIDLVERVTNG